MSTQNALYGFDFTLHNWESIESVKEKLKTIAKKWVFQEEIGEETNKNHLQGRISLKTKERLQTLRKKLKGYRLSPTHVEEGNFNYVMKPDTRTQGPWSDLDAYIPRQVREMKVLYEWQEDVIEDADVWDKRTINIIYDRKGHNGKTSLGQYVTVHGIGEYLTYTNDFKDIMRMIMDLPKRKLYIIDLPRAIGKEKLLQFWAGVEMLKSGVAFDDRYEFKREFFDCPNVWIFTNILPEKNMLSSDRWRTWEITMGKTLLRKDI